jgi:hypothetical protein
MSKAMRAYLLYLVKITATGVVFTAIIYNITFPELIYRQVAITLAYFVFTLFFDKPQYGNQLVNCLLIAVPSTIIDSSVLITTPSLVPLRFPFSTLFPIIGCLAGYLALRRKYTLIGLLAIAFAGFSIVSFLFIIPRFIYRMELAKTHPVNQSFLSARFLNRNGDTVSLNNYKADWMFVDLFFVGCAPCDLKEEMFSELVSEKKSGNYRLIIICDGSISTFEAFVKHVRNKSENQRIVFLYDFKSNIDQYITGVNGYPHEVIFRYGVAYKSYVGFNEESYQINKVERIKLIESTQ